MKRFVPVFCICFLLGAAVAAAVPDRVPFAVRDDFETGELFAWEEYPYAQDIGYDPTLLCQSDPAHNGSRFAIARIVKPNDMIDLSEGFTKEIDLWTVASTRLKCAVFLMADRKPATLELSLCLFDGGRYFYTLKAPAVNRWLELDIPLAGFASGGKTLVIGAHIQAVTVKAFYPLVTHLMSYTISMDDFSLNGERQRRFIAEKPKSVHFEMFGYSILDGNFHYGEPVGITVQPETAPGRGPLVSVAADVIDGAGKTVASGVPLAPKGGAWSSDRLYTIGTSDARGQWTVNLAGKDAAGKEIRWGFRFIMPGKPVTPRDHPRLHFTASELADRLAKQSPAEKKILENAIVKPDYFKNVDISGMNEAARLPSESLTGGPYSVVSAAYDNWRGPMSQLGSVIEAGAWRYAITGDREAGMKAKEALLKLSSFTRWNHPWQDAHHNHTYFPVGYTIGPVALGFDALYPLMTDDERKLVRTGLMEKGIKPFYRDMVEMNRMPSSLSNHIAVLVGNLALAATAIYGEDPSNPTLEPWLSGILAKMKRFMDRTYYPDGGYGEPVTYQDMATRDLVQGLDALERNFGIDYSTTTHLKDSWMYPLQATFSNGRYPDFGDVSPNYGFAGPSFMWFAHRLKNPYAYDYVRKSFEAGRGGMLGWLWYTTGIESKPREELPASKLFPVKGNMVMRSGWNDDGSVLVFRCGPNSNHYHVDQGTFYLMTNGEELLTDAGHGSSYYANLNYPCYYTQPVGHNVMLVDFNAESQAPADYENSIAALRDYPHITAGFAGAAVDDVSGDLTCVYKGSLASYTRTILFVKPDIILLRDKVNGNGPHTYNWLFHAEHTAGKNPIRWDGNRMTVNRTKACLTMDVLAPEIASRKIQNSDRDEGFLTLNSARDTYDTEFLAVMNPRAMKAPGDTVSTVSSSLIRADGWLGARVKKTGDDGETIAFFRSGGSGGRMVEGFSADAERFAVATGSDGSVKTAFVRGISLAKPGALILCANRPISVSLEFGTSSGIAIETESDAPASVTIGPVAAKPSSVVLDGAPLEGWTYDVPARTLRFPVPKGHATVTVR